MRRNRPMPLKGRPGHVRDYFWYDFGTGNDIFVTVDTTPVTVAGTAGMAYAVKSISGEFEGLTITGLYGPSATYTDNGVIDFDNAVFTSDSGGVTLDGNSGIISASTLPVSLLRPPTESPTTCIRWAPR